MTLARSTTQLAKIKRIVRKEENQIFDLPIKEVEKLKKQNYGIVRKENGRN